MGGKSTTTKDENSLREIIEAWIARAEWRRVHLFGRVHRIDERRLSVLLSIVRYDPCCFMAEEDFEPGEPLLVEITDLGRVEAEVWVFHDPSSVAHGPRRP